MLQTVKSFSKELLGERVFYTLGYYYLLSHIRFRNSLTKLMKYKNKHVGERCFILGNGPSLKNTDLSMLKNEYTFGLNRIYLLFPKLGYQPSYYVAVNKLVIAQCSDEILNSIKSVKFISYDARYLIPYTNDMVFLYSRNISHFFRDITKGVSQGATVTNVALQIAYYMGFQQVILVGVDHSYSAVGKPNEMVVSNGNDPNHFDSGYFGKGFRWNLPDLDASEQGYQLAKEAFESDGREILDATIGGKLYIFRKVDYSSLF